MDSPFTSELPRALSSAERLGDSQRSQGFESASAFHPAAAAERAERIAKLAEFYEHDEAGAKRGISPERFELFLSGSYDFGSPADARQSRREKLTR